MEKQISFSFISRGGARKGAGRPRLQLHDAQHVARPRLNSRIPFHVTLRFDELVPNLRDERFVRQFTKAVAGAREKGLNVNQFSILSNHIHVLGETESNETLTSGILSLQSSIVWALRRIFRYAGQVFRGRFHLRELKSPREVRNALLYVIFNHAKHCQMAPFADLFSSAFSFHELRRFVARPGRAPRWQNEIAEALAPARSWLQTVGWKRQTNTA
jgi:putative transposase